MRGAVLHGLQTLAPAIDWELVWGPVTSRGPAALTDSSAMYVVRDRRAPHRHVVAIRGTNPISASDWLLGDFLVGTTVPWPYGAATDGAAISTSTARELATLQAMRAHPPGPGSADALPAVVRHAVDALTRGGHAVLGDTLAAHPSRFEAQIEKIAPGRHRAQERRRRARAPGRALVIPSEA